MAVGRGRCVLAVRHATMLHGQAEALLPMADETMRDAGLAVSALDLVAVTIGPGSFTGIRVGLAAARGIALGADLPLIGVSSFEAAVAALPTPLPADHCLLVALESRRADLYAQLFDPAGLALGEPAAIVPEALAAAVAALAAASPIAIAGDAAVRAAAALAGRPATVVVEDTAPVALGILCAALARWRKREQSGPVRPLYLRPPDVTRAGGRRPDVA